MSKKQKFFSLFIEFLVAENRPSQKNIESLINDNFDFGAYCWFCRFFALLFWPSIFFWLGLFSATRNSIVKKIFVFYSFRFMPAQLTRFGIDRNSAILSTAWRVFLLSDFFLLQRRFFFSNHCFAWW